MRAVLRAPGAAPLFAASCVARLPLSAMGLLLVIVVEHATGSYRSGGLTAAAYAFALAGASPRLARAIDRRGQTLVLCAGALVAASGMAALALLPGTAPLGAFVAAAIVAGAGQPPVGACMRALWPELVGDADRRHAAYALEGAAIELVFLIGPLLIVGGIASWSTDAALGACAVLLLAGDFGFALQRRSRAWRPHAAQRPTDRAGALRHSGVRLLVASLTLFGVCFGSIEVAIPATLEQMGSPQLTGVVFAAWGVGSVAGGLVAGLGGAARRPRRRLALLLCASGAGHAAVALAGAPLTLALLLALAGTTVAPTFTCANGLLDHLAPPGSLTEAFTWMTAGLTIGAASGSALAGVLTAALSPAFAFPAVGCSALTAAQLARHIPLGSAADAAPARRCAGSASAP